MIEDLRFRRVKPYEIIPGAAAYHITGTGMFSVVEALVDGMWMQITEHGLRNNTKESITKNVHVSELFPDTEKPENNQAK